jgi:hypothetical protein
MKRFGIATMLVFVCLSAGDDVWAQVDEHKFEGGAVFTSITLTDFQDRVSPGFATGDATVKGFGGRLAYNLTKNIAIDGEASFFPAAHFSNEELGQKMQGLLGVKAGWRNRKVGVFAKARPGVIWFGEFSSRGSCSGTPFGSVCGVAHEKDFAMDLGGVFEFYPSERAIVRVDAGDTIIRYQSRPSGVGFPGIPAATKHNLQLSIGFGWRF